VVRRLDGVALAIELLDPDDVIVVAVGVVVRVTNESSRLGKSCCSSIEGLADEAA
jgi:hypothetical protein